MRLVDFAEPGPSKIPLRTLHHWKAAGKIEVTQDKREGGGGIEYFISPEQQKKALEMRAKHPGKRKPKDE